MSQTTAHMLQQINSLKQSLSTHTDGEILEFESPENFLYEFTTNQQIIRLYWDTDRPRATLSKPNEYKTIELHDFEGLPKECVLNRAHLSAYLKNAYVRLANYDNNAGYKLHFNLKLLGGANIVDPNRAPHRLWPNAIIPIFVDSRSFSQQELSIILSAVNDWATHTQFSFKVHFKNMQAQDSGIIYNHLYTQNLTVSCSINNPSSMTQSFATIILNDAANKQSLSLNEEPKYADWVLIQKYTPSCMINPQRDESDSCNVCQSAVGRQGGQQLISCKLGDSFDENALKHELGHAIGFYHEQQRSDRDAFVKAPNLGANDPNYGKGLDAGARRESKEYDFKSIMHYFFGSGMIGSQSVSMSIQNSVPKTQYRQLVELGATPGYIASSNENDLISPDNRARLSKGIAKVGKTGHLSQTDIEAANYLAKAAQENSRPYLQKAQGMLENDEASSYVMQKASYFSFRKRN